MVKPNLEEENYQDFEVTIDETQSDTNIDIGDNLSIVAVIENKGTEKDEQEITLDFGTAVDVDSVMLELDPEASEEITLNHTVTEELTGTMWAATVNSETAVDSLDVYIREKAFFEIEINEDQSDTGVRREQELTVTAKITNTGESTDTQAIHLAFDTIIVDSQEDITLAENEEQEVSLSFNIPAEKTLGSYSTSIASNNDIDFHTVFVLKATRTLNLSINDYNRGQIVVAPQADRYDESVINSSAESFEIVRGTQVILNIQVTENNNFSHWTGDITSEQELSASIDFILDEDRTIEAILEPKGTTLHINDEGGGGLESHSSGIYEYDRGDVISIEAEEPDYGWKFAGWKSLVGGRDDEKYVADPHALSTTIKMSEDTIYITAVYKKIMYNLEIRTAGQGTVEPFTGIQEYQKGSTVSLTPHPAEGYIFTGWEGAHNEEIEDNNIYIDSDKEIIALFDMHTVILTINSTDGGSTSPEGSVAAQANSEVSITAISDVGYDFNKWAGSDNIDNINANTTHINIQEADETILAEFTEGEICIKLQISGPGSTNPEPDIYCFSPGENIQIDAIADDGAEFVGWTGPVIDNDSRTTQIDIENL